MDEIKVKRVELLGKIKENRAKHRDLFLKAQEGYRELMIEALDQMLRDAKDGKSIRRAVTMPEPVDHTDDYDTVIDMLEMSVDDEIMIDQMSFSQYVRDKWQWKAHADFTNTAYAAKMIPR
jgi:hypothetical protein